MLLRETGKSLIQHTYEAARRARKPRGLCIATDHEEIAADVRVVRRRGGDDQSRLCQWHRSYRRDRRADARDRIFVNVQGDEPEMSGQSIDRVIELLEEHPELPMATVATPIRHREQLSDPACVKVVFPIHRDAAGRLSGNALYFSRSQIPFAREWDDSLLAADPPHFYLHLGLYAYRREFLAAANAPAALAAGKAGKPGATARARRRLSDHRRRGERIVERHRHAGRLSGVCSADGGEIKTRPAVKPVHCVTTHVAAWQYSIYYQLKWRGPNRRLVGSKDMQISTLARDEHV